MGIEVYRSKMLSYNYIYNIINPDREFKDFLKCILNTFKKKREISKNRRKIFVNHNI